MLEAERHRGRVSPLLHSLHHPNPTKYPTDLHYTCLSPRSAQRSPSTARELSKLQGEKARVTGNWG